MLVLLLQALVAVVKLLFGMVAMRVSAPWVVATPRHRLSWRILGVGFLLGGVSDVAQFCLLAPQAFFAGKGTPFYEAYLRWLPAMNHSRSVLVICLAVVIALVPLVRIGRRADLLAWTAFLSAILLGGTIGWREGGYDSARHMSAVAVFNTVELVTLLGALMVILLASSADRYLWLSLVIYSLSLALNAISFSVLAWIRVLGVWVPPTATVQAYVLLLYCGMLGVAVRRLRLARRHVAPTGLLEQPDRAPASLAGVR